jgi:outer membrane protein assembly factor BamB
LYRKSLFNNSIDNNIFLSNIWCTKYNGLIKTPFFDYNDLTSGYVVYYSEIKQSYLLTKFNLNNGDIIWEIKVTNGGYGTPSIFNNLVTTLNEFDGISAFDKENGKLIWEIHTKYRIRSSINIIDENLVFSSGNSIFFINNKGEIINKIKINKSFLFGTISKLNDHYLTLGTKYDEQLNDSCLFLFAFNATGNLLFEIKLGASFVISSDTSGFWIEGQDVIVSYYNEIILINGSNGFIKWRKKVNGFVGRHLPVSDGNRIYYTTMLGIIGCLEKKSGNKLWEISTQEGLIFSPPSIFGNTLLVLADCSLYSIDKLTGVVYEKNITGHSPYSAPVIFNNKILLGGGEPPLNGVLLCFSTATYNSFENEKLIIDYFEIGNYIENEKMQISISLKKSIKNINLDVSVISLENYISPKFQQENNFIFEFNLKPNNPSGYYSIPVSFYYNNKFKIEMIRIHLFIKEKQPKKFKLHKYYNDKIQQKDDLYSGAAISELIFKEYGKNISQKDFREIIDYVKKKSEWKDADFQTWRLILKRVLSSPAKNITEFKDLEK